MRAAPHVDDYAYLTIILILAFWLELVPVMEFGRWNGSAITSFREGPSLPGCVNWFPLVLLERSPIRQGQRSRTHGTAVVAPRYDPHLITSLLVGHISHKDEFAERTLVLVPASSGDPVHLHHVLPQTGVLYPVACPQEHRRAPPSCLMQVEESSRYSGGSESALSHGQFEDKHSRRVTLRFTISALLCRCEN